MSKWFVAVTYTDLDGNEQDAEGEFESDKRPDQTWIIHQLVPRGCTTTSYSCIKV